MANHLHDDELIALATGDSSTDRSTTRSDSPAHLQDCAACRARLQEFRQTLDLTASAPASMEWNSLQSGAFVHRVRRGIEQRERPRASPWWQPALAGATMAVVALLTIQSLEDSMVSDDLVASETPAIAAAGNSMAGGVIEGSDPAVDDFVDLSDDELLTMIDAYLIETSSEDELLWTLGDLNDEDLLAVLEE